MTPNSQNPAVEVEGDRLSPEQAMAAWRSLALAVKPLAESRARQDAETQH